eukprot:8689294-Pyramimonas_sp.AAC.1
MTIDSVYPPGLSPPQVSGETGEFQMVMYPGFWWARKEGGCRCDGMSERDVVRNVLLALGA